MSTTGYTNSRTTTHQQTPGFKAARDKLVALFPTGHKAEIYRRSDGETQVEWLPKRPNLKQHAVREAILPHYDAAILAFATQFGKPVWVHGSAYEDGAKVGS